MRGSRFVLGLLEILIHPAHALQHNRCVHVWKAAAFNSLCEKVGSNIKAYSSSGGSLGGSVPR